MENPLKTSQARADIAELHRIINKPPFNAKRLENYLLCREDVPETLPQTPYEPANERLIKELNRHD